MSDHEEIEIKLPEGTITAKGNAEFIGKVKSALVVLLSGKPYSSAAPLSVPATAPSTALPTFSLSGGKDLKTFIAEKTPKSDSQFATTVAYYYRFEAPESQRKDDIGSNDLQEATRIASWTRFKDPNKTLNNTYSVGFLDRGSEKGKFKINAVGENLVAMALPNSNDRSRPQVKPKPKSAPKKKTA